MMLCGPPQQGRCFTFFNRRNRPLQDAEKVRQSKKTVIWFVWSVWFFG
jgi:hypothetical protein